MNPIKSLALAALLALGLAAGQAQVTVQNLGSPTNLPTIIEASSTSNQVSWVAVPKFGSLAVQFTFNTATNVGADACGIRFVPSVDGTNLSKTTWFNLYTTANGFTNVVATTNFARTQLEGYSHLAVAYWTNGTAGILTNKGVIFNRIYNSASQ